MRKAALAVGTALALVPATSAVAAPRPAYQAPVVNKVNPVVVADPTGAVSAVVHASYTCYGGNPTHLYIGLKQGPLIDATEHTSSQFAETFFSTNWNADQGSLALNCDGKMHEQGFTLKPDDYFTNVVHGGSTPPMRAGQAFVQFCLFDSTALGEGSEQGFAFDYSMKKVVLG